MERLLVNILKFKLLMWKLLKLMFFHLKLSELKFDRRGGRFGSSLGSCGVIFGCLEGVLGSFLVVLRIVLVLLGWS